MVRGEGGAAVLRAASAGHWRCRGGQEEGWRSAMGAVLKVIGVGDEAGQGIRCREGEGWKVECCLRCAACGILAQSSLRCRTRCLLQPPSTHLLCRFHALLQRLEQRLAQPESGLPGCEEPGRSGRSSHGSISSCRSDSSSSSSSGGGGSSSRGGSTSSRDSSSRDSSSRESSSSRRRAPTLVMVSSQALDEAVQPLERWGWKPGWKRRKGSASMERTVTAPVSDCALQRGLLLESTRRQARCAHTPPCASPAALPWCVQVAHAPLHGRYRPRGQLL